MRQAVRELGQTIVMVTHDPVAASYADRALFLADGRIVDDMAEPSPDRCSTASRASTAADSTDTHRPRRPEHHVSPHAQRAPREEAATAHHRLAVMLGVAFMAGTLVFTDTLNHTFDSLLRRRLRGHRRLSSAASPSSIDSTAATDPAIDATVVDTVAQADGVAGAEGDHHRLRPDRRHDGKAIGNPGMGAPTFGETWIDRRRAQPVPARRRPRARGARRDRHRPALSRQGATSRSATTSACSPRPGANDFTITGIADVRRRRTRPAVHQPCCSPPTDAQTLSPSPASSTRSLSSRADGRHPGAAAGHDRRDRARRRRGAHRRRDHQGDARRRQGRTSAFFNTFLLVFA